MIGALKVAVITGGMQFGGSTIFLLQLTSSLRSHGIASQIFSFRNDHPLAADFAAAEIPVHVTDETKSIFEDRLTSLYQKLAEFSPNIVIANLGAEAFETLRYVPVGVARIGMVHDIGTRDVVAKYRNVLDAVAFVNPHWAKLNISQNSNLLCEYLAHGIPLSEASMLRNANPAEPLKLTYFGSLGPHKGTRYFPQIVSQLRKRSIPFRWTMYGDGSDEPYLREQLAAEIRSGEVTISPRLSRAELFRKIRQHDIFIMASDAEGGPFTLLEAMSLGLVPVCNDIPCLVEEVISAENGFIIPRDPDKYAEIISLLHSDRTRLERMSAAARKTINERYSAEAMAERYLQFMRKIVPTPVAIAWSARIKLKPLQGASLVTRITHSTALGRQLRRFLKRSPR